MPKVIMHGWQEGLQKVSLTYLQTRVLGISLPLAKANVDDLLDNKMVIIEIDDSELAISFFLSAGKLGVNCTMEDDN